MKWLVLIYRIPREPTKGRVYVWRKLKQLGALALQDAAWVLPATDRCRENFQWLASEIVELGGESLLFDGELLMGDTEAALRERFEVPVRAAYEEILAAIEDREPDLAALSKKYQQTLVNDYFRCPLAEQARKKLLSAKGGTR
jgi:hypothetical protein